ncbi:biotin/methionine sulfoxide reductase [Inquilinus ginsengisoli]|uniref:molybdopterin guanine dinucleotide-containing S/N-oxide reductase n=1 Tax=Inquilinus ginsengisoli TaxID=363840 RepID=UPI003D1D35C8
MPRLSPSSSHYGAVMAVVEGDKMVGIQPYASDIDPSPIINSLPGMVHSNLRIPQPMVRAGWLADRHRSDGSRRGADAFVPVSWETALALVAGELERVRTEHGAESIYGGSYGWGSAGRLHNAPTLLRRMLGFTGGYTASVNNYSFGAALPLMPHIIGDFNRVLVETTDWRSIAGDGRLVVAFGGMPPRNSQIASGGTGKHQQRDWNRRSREAGVQFVYIGPVRDDMAEEAGAEWLAPRPNTDTAIMLGLAHTLVAEGLYDRGFVDRCTTGFDRFLPYLMGQSDGTPKDADWAAAISGLSADTIRGLARRMASQRTMISLSWSLQRGDHGEQPYWMGTVLAAMLGQIGLPGGGIGYGYGAEANVGSASDGRSRARIIPGPNPTGRYIPVARISDLLLRPGETDDYNGHKITYPDTRLVYWAGGNPFHHHQDLNRLLRAWAKPETVIVQEPWWTPVARRADIVLPATTSFERNDIGGAARDPYILAMPQAIPPVGQSRSDFDILTELSDRAGAREAFTEGRDEMGWVQSFYEGDRRTAAEAGIELPGFQEFWEIGHVELPLSAKPKILLEAFRADPVANKLPTPSGRIEVFSDRIAGFGYDDCPGHPTWFEPAEWLGAPETERFPLHLISNQPKTRLHSQLDAGVTSRSEKVADREPVWIHPADAAARGIQDGDVVRLFNDRGACLAGALVTDRVMPGVIQLATGAWYDPEVPGEVGALCKHGNPNVLTRDHGTSRLGQGPSAHTCLVEIARLEGPAPRVTAFDPPVILDPRAEAAE